MQVSAGYEFDVPPCRFERTAILVVSASLSKRAGCLMCRDRGAGMNGADKSALLTHARTRSPTTAGYAWAIQRRTL